MKLFRCQTVLRGGILALLLLVGLPSDAMTQGRGRRANNSDKKCAKFVNCHDARDGRLDNRGPRRRLTLADRIRIRNRRDRRFEDDDRRFGRRARIVRLDHRGRGRRN